jgi:hypothetical protein
LVVQGVEAAFSGEIKELYIVKIFEFVDGIGGWSGSNVGAYRGVDIEVIDLGLFLLVFAAGSL